MSRFQRRRSAATSPQSVLPVEAIRPEEKNTPSDVWQTIIVFFFNLLFFATPLLYTWVNEELFEFNKMIGTYVITFLILGAWAIRMISQKKIFIRRTPFDIFILLFFLSQILSTLFSIHPYTSFFGYYTRFHGGLLSTFCYITLFYAFVSNVEKKHLSLLFGSIFGSAFLVTIMAIPEHFGHSFSCLMIGTSQDAVKSGPAAYFNWPGMISHYNADCWIQDVQDRVFASFGQPNWLAAYAITLIPIGSALTILPRKVSSKGNFFSRVFFGGITFLLFVTLLFTKSRSGMLGLIVGVLYFVLLQSIFIFTQKERSPLFHSFSELLGGVLITSFIIASLIFGTPYTPNFGEKLLKGSAVPATEATAQTLQPANRLDVGGTDSGDIRKIVWSGALKVWQRYPILGSGVETFAYSYYKDRPMEHNLVSEWDFLYNKAHNEFLNFLATTGIVGLISYLLLLGAFIGFPVLVLLSPQPMENIMSKLPLTKKLPFSLSFPDPQSKSLLFLTASTMSTGLVALSVSNFFGFSTVMVTILLFLFPAFFLTLANEFNNRKDTSNWLSFSFPTISQNGQYISYATIAATTLIFVYWIYGMWEGDKLFALGKSYNQAGKVEEAVTLLQQANSWEPNEATFTDELSLAYARYATAVLDTTKDATTASKIAQQALATSAQTMDLNPVHLNFYKTRVRVLLTLAPYKPGLILDAITTLKKARELSPTDPKLLYNLAVLQLSQPDLAKEGFKNLLTTIEMKPNYEAAQMSVADEYLKQGNTVDAVKHYKYILENIQPNNEVAKAEIEEITSPKKDKSASPSASPSATRYNTPKK